MIDPVTGKSLLTGHTLDEIFDTIERTEQDNHYEEVAEAIREFARQKLKPNGLN
jgi:phage-related minor tail protein